METILLWMVSGLQAIGLDLSDALHYMGIVVFFMLVLGLVLLVYRDRYEELSLMRIAVPFVVLLVLMVTMALYPIHNCDVLDCQAPSVVSESQETPSP